MEGDILVTISSGKIRGKVEEDVNGKSFYSFMGIPYAQPPCGKLRFKAPLPVEPWNDIFDATKEGPPCIQKQLITKKLIGTEDCLHLNVYTKKFSNVTQNELKPVMVFIHGGAFVTGSNLQQFYGPQYLITEDIVLVIINYRLGIFGFLSLDDDSLEVPGNAAFKDMILALQWVQENIKQFSGDPNNVTIFGESAGSVAVHLLMLSSKTKGLFHKAIAQSGSALNGWIYARPTGAKEVAQKLGMNFENQQEFLEQLQKAPVGDILAVQNKIEDEEILGNKPRYIGLVIEKPSANAFLTQHPWDIIKKGNYHQIPLIMGYNNCEGMLFETLVKKRKRPGYWEYKESNVPGLLGLKEGSQLSKALGEKITNYYLGEGPYTLENTIQKLYMITTDNCFLWGIYHSIRNHARYSSSPIYFYRMSIETELNIFKKISNIETPGVCHADDLGYLFTNAFSPEIEPNSAEDLGRKRFCKLWTNFARNGNPTPSIDEILTVTWLPVDFRKMNFLDIGHDLKVLENPDNERIKFWDEIYSMVDAQCKL